MTTHSLKGIISKVSEIKSQISLEEIRLASRTSSSFKDLEQRTLQQIAYIVEGIERDLATSNLTGADLAIRSRRGYQWLKFLSMPRYLVSHLDALQRINLFVNNERGKPGLNITFELYHQGSLYKVLHQGRQSQMIAQESFLIAPDRIINALVGVALDPSSGEDRTKLREFTFTKEYKQIRKKLEYIGVPSGSFADGKIHNLEESFHRVNHSYFQDKLDKPHLVWSQRLTHRKFGHYQWDTDTVMVSSSLDHKRVPADVVDFVVYHELLHKKLGARRANQNRIAHTREFRQAEEQFIHFEKARQFLNRIAKKKARSL